MPRSIKKVTKKSAFKEEEVRDFYTHALDYAKKRQKQGIYLITAILIAAFFILSIYFYNQSQSKKALDIEAEAYQYFYGNDLPSDMKEEEKYKKALELFQDAYKIDSTGSIQLIIGHCYLKLGDIDNAIRAYNQFISKYPDSYLIPAAYQAISSAYVKRGSPDKALNALQDLSKFKGGIFKDTVLIKEAEIYENKGEKEEAQKKYEQIISEYPDSQWIALAKAKVKTDDKKEEASDKKDKRKSTTTGKDSETIEPSGEKKQDKDQDNKKTSDKQNTEKKLSVEKTQASESTEKKSESDDKTQQTEK